ncbi:MAG: glycosyltransferase family 39 protein [Alphaproteobacteria bacterium]|nr:glycosyltransferase family 39 protein [Alphaproteobacteria bacterium]
MSFLKRYPLACFLFIHFIVWSSLPLLRGSLPMDSVEAIIWGQYCDWGTNKHPSLSGHMAYWAYNMFGAAHYGIYALSQLCILLAFIYIYKLANCFLSKDKSILSVMLLEGVIYYGYSAMEFNVNVVSLALWPMTIYYFYKSLQKDNMSDWILTGVFAGLNLFNKYVSCILLLCMLMLMVLDNNARQKFKTCKPYICAIFCILVFLPHFLWLYEHNFFVMDYFLGRSSKAGFDNVPILRHIIYPIRFFCAQILFSLGTLLIYFIPSFKVNKEKIDLTKFDKHFLFCLGVLPLLVMVLISIVGGIKLKSMWGFPVLYMIGILLFKFFPREFNDRIKVGMMKGVYIIMALMSVALVSVILFNKSDKLHLQAEKYALRMENIYHQYANKKPFKYVAGDVWWTTNVALYAPSEPKPIIWGNIKKNPWFDETDFVSSGALIITAGKGEYEAIRKILDNVSDPLTLELEIKNPFGKIKRKTIYYGFYNVETR